MIKSALILSAGFGTRLRPITLTTPKALIKVNQKPMLQRCIELLVLNDINNIIINTHYLGDEIKNFISHNDFEANITLVDEPEILGTGGSILNITKNFYHEPILVINCDALFYGGNPIEKLIKHWKPLEMDMLSLLQDKNKLFKKYKGDFNIDAIGNLNRLDELQYIFSGCYIISPSIFLDDEVKFFPITDIIFKFNKRYFGIVNEFNWIDIGSLEDLEIANNIMVEYEEKY